MGLPKFSSVSTLSLAGVVLLVGGLGIAIVASQQTQETRSHAAANCLSQGGVCKYSSCSGGETYLSASCDGSAYMVCCKPPPDYINCAQYGDRGVCRYSGAYGGGGGCQTGETSTHKSCYGVAGTTICCIKNETAPPPSSAPPPSTNTGASTPSQCGSAGCCATVFPGAKCQYTSNACPGGYETNYCGGGNDYKCCKGTSTKPAPPTGITATCPGTSLTVKWTPVSGYSNYVLFIYDETANGPTVYNPDKNVSSGSTPVTGSSFTFNNLISGHQYSYWMNTATGGGAPYSDPAPAPYGTKVTCGGSSSGGTTFNLNLLHHGIGKGGDNRNPNGGGNPDPDTKKRNVLVAVENLDEEVIIEGILGEVTFDSTFGGFKGQIDMGTVLQNGAYVIKAKLSDSLWGEISRNITAGAANDIPVMKLVNGDVNGDAQLDIADYNILIGCYSDFDAPAASCDETKKAISDIDDDGDVNQFDLNLFLREMSVQQ